MNILKSRKACLLVLSSFIFLAIKAQSDFRPGYIINLQNDTVPGLISLKNEKANAKACIFKREKESKKLVYMPGQIKSYQLSGGKYYVSGNTLRYQFESPVFVECVMKGALGIYYYKGDTKEHYFVSKDTLVIELDQYVIVGGMSGDDASPRKPQQYREQLKLLMKDQPTLFQRIDRSVCNKQDLISLARDYQKACCPLQQTVELTASTVKNTKPRYGVFFSTGLSHLSSPPYNMYVSDYDVAKFLDFKNSFTYEIGAVISLYLNFIDENKFCLQLAPALNFAQYHSRTERTIFPLTYHCKTDIKFSTLKLPLLFKYSLYSSDWPVIPFFKFGPGCAVYLDQKGTYEYYSFPTGGSLGTEPVYKEPLNKVTGATKFYYTAGMGADVKCGTRLVSAGIIYERGGSQLQSTRSDLLLQIELRF